MVLAALAAGRAHDWIVTRLKAFAKMPTAVAARILRALCDSTTLAGVLLALVRASPARELLAAIATLRPLGVPLLHLAVLHRDAAAVRVLLNAKVAPAVAQQALPLAIGRAPDVVEALIAKKVVFGRLGTLTPAHAAVLLGSRALLERLVAIGAALNSAHRGESPLFACLRQPEGLREHLVALILASETVAFETMPGASPEAVRSNQRVLHACIDKAFTREIHMLLPFRVPLDDPDTGLPASLAVLTSGTLCDAEKTAIVQLFGRSGVHALCATRTHEYVARRRTGAHLAAELDTPELLVSMIERAWECALAQDGDGDTPLHLAVRTSLNVPSSNPAESPAPVEISAAGRPVSAASAQRRSVTPATSQARSVTPQAHASRSLAKALAVAPPSRAAAVLTTRNDDGDTVAHLMCRDLTTHLPALEAALGQVPSAAEALTTPNARGETPVHIALACAHLGDSVACKLVSLLGPHAMGVGKKALLSIPTARLGPSARDGGTTPVVVQRSNVVAMAVGRGLTRVAAALSALLAPLPTSEMPSLVEAALYYPSLTARCVSRPEERERAVSMTMTLLKSGALRSPISPTTKEPFVHVAIAKSYPAVIEALVRGLPADDPMTLPPVVAPDANTGVTPAVLALSLPEAYARHYPHPAFSTARVEAACDALRALAELVPASTWKGLFETPSKASSASLTTNTAAEGDASRSQRPAFLAPAPPSPAGLHGSVRSVASASRLGASVLRGASASTLGGKQPACASAMVLACRSGYPELVEAAEALVAGRGAGKGGAPPPTSPRRSSGIAAGGVGEVAPSRGWDASSKLLDPSVMGASSSSTAAASFKRSSSSSALGRKPIRSFLAAAVEVMRRSRQSPPPEPGVLSPLVQAVPAAGASSSRPPWDSSMTESTETLHTAGTSFSVSMGGAEMSVLARSRAKRNQEQHQQQLQAAKKQPPVLDVDHLPVAAFVRALVHFQRSTSEPPEDFTRRCQLAASGLVLGLTMGDDEDRELLDARLMLRLARLLIDAGLPSALRVLLSSIVGCEGARIEDRAVGTLLQYALTTPLMSWAEACREEMAVAVAGVDLMPLETFIHPTGTALHATLRRGWMSVLRLIIGHVRNVNASTADVPPPIVTLIRSVPDIGADNAAKLWIALMDTGKVDFEQARKCVGNLFASVVGYGSVDLARVALQAGAPTAALPPESTLVHQALLKICDVSPMPYEGGRIKDVLAIALNDGDPGDVSRPARPDGLTPLLLACRYANPDVVISLLRLRARADTSSVDGGSALHVIARSHNPRVAERELCMSKIMAHAPNLSVAKTDGQGESVLHICAKRGMVAQLKKFMDNYGGVDYNQPNRSKRTIVDLLLFAQADWDSPIATVVRIVKMCLQKGYRPAAGSPAIGAILEHKSAATLELIPLLVDACADDDARREVLLERVAQEDPVSTAVRRIEGISAQLDRLRESSASAGVSPAGVKALDVPQADDAGDADVSVSVPEPSAVSAATDPAVLMGNLTEHRQALIAVLHFIVSHPAYVDRYEVCPMLLRTALRLALPDVVQSVCARHVRPKSLPIAAIHDIVDAIAARATAETGGGVVAAPTGPLKLAGASRAALDLADEVLIDSMGYVLPLYRVHADARFAAPDETAKVAARLDRILATGSVRATMLTLEFMHLLDPPTLWAVARPSQLAAVASSDALDIIVEAAEVLLRLRPRLALVHQPAANDGDEGVSSPLVSTSRPVDAEVTEEVTLRLETPPGTPQRGPDVSPPPTAETAPRPCFTDAGGAASAAQRAACATPSTAHAAHDIPDDALTADRDGGPLAMDASPLAGAVRLKVRVIDALLVSLAHHPGFEAAASDVDGTGNTLLHCLLEARAWDCAAWLVSVFPSSLAQPQCGGGGGRSEGLTPLAQLVRAIADPATSPEDREELTNGVHDLLDVYADTVDVATSATPRLGGFGGGAASTADLPDHPVRVELPADERSAFPAEEECPELEHSSNARGDTTTLLRFALCHGLHELSTALVMPGQSFTQLDVRAMVRGLASLPIVGCLTLPTSHKEGEKDASASGMVPAVAPRPQGMSKPTTPSMHIGQPAEPVDSASASRTESALPLPVHTGSVASGGGLGFSYQSSGKGDDGTPRQQAEHSLLRLLDQHALALETFRGGAWYPWWLRDCLAAGAYDLATALLRRVTTGEHLKNFRGVPSSMSGAATGGAVTPQMQTFDSSAVMDTSAAPSSAFGGPLLGRGESAATLLTLDTSMTPAANAMRAVDGTGVVSVAEVLTAVEPDTGRTLIHVVLDSEDEDARDRAATAFLQLTLRVLRVAGSGRGAAAHGSSRATLSLQHQASVSASPALGHGSPAGVAVVHPSPLVGAGAAAGQLTPAKFLGLQDRLHNDTVLLKAARNGAPHTVALALKSGASLSSTSRQGESAAHAAFAAWCQSPAACTAVLHQLVPAMCSASAPLAVATLAKTRAPPFDATPLELAVLHGAVAAFETLFDAQFRENELKETTARRLLHFAFEHAEAAPAQTKLPIIRKLFRQAPLSVVRAQPLDFILHAVPADAAPSMHPAAPAAAAALFDLARRHHPIRVAALLERLAPPPPRDRTLTADEQEYEALTQAAPSSAAAAAQIDPRRGGPQAINFEDGDNGLTNSASEASGHSRNSAGVRDTVSAARAASSSSSDASHPSMDPASLVAALLTHPAPEDVLDHAPWLESLLTAHVETQVEARLTSPGASQQKKQTSATPAGANILLAAAGVDDVPLLPIVLQRMPSAVRWCWLCTVASNCEPLRDALLAETSQRGLPTAVSWAGMAHLGGVAHRFGLGASHAVAEAVGPAAGRQRVEHSTTSGDAAENSGNASRAVVDAQTDAMMMALVRHCPAEALRHALRRGVIPVDRDLSVALTEHRAQGARGAEALRARDEVRQIMLDFRVPLAPCALELMVGDGAAGNVQPGAATANCSSARRSVPSNQTVTHAHPNPTPAADAASLVPPRTVFNDTPLHLALLGSRPEALGAALALIDDDADGESNAFHRRAVEYCDDRAGALHVVEQRRGNRVAKARRIVLERVLGDDSRRPRPAPPSPRRPLPTSSTPRGENFRSSSGGGGPPRTARRLESALEKR